MGQRIYSFDAEMLLKDAGLVAADAAGQVDGANKVIDVGAARLDGVVIVDVSAIEIADNNELYHVILQGSNDATFATGVENLAQISFGATEVRPGGAQDSTVGRYEMPFTNEQDDTTYRYLRIYIDVAGTIATGINFTAWIAKQPGR